MRLNLTSGLGLLALLLAATPVHAAWPLAFQGTLAKGEAPVDRSVAMTFRIHDAVEDGTVLWVDVQPVPVSAGFFLAYLDLDSDPELAAALDAGVGLWLGVQIDQANELTPRVPLAGTLETVLAGRSRGVLGCGDDGDGVLVQDQCFRFVTEQELAASLAAHAGNVTAHHARYTDPEAVAAVGADASHWTRAPHPRDLVRSSDLAAIATSGLADDLTGGTLPDGVFPDEVLWRDDLSPVATSGRYGDLTGRPDDRLAALEQQVAALVADNATLRSLITNPVTPAEIWVDPERGDDAQHDGLAADRPKQTIAAAWALLPHVVTRSCTIHLASGTHAPAQLGNREAVPGASITLQGSLANPNSVLVDCGGGPSDGLHFEHAVGVVVQGLSVKHCQDGVVVARWSGVDLQHLVLENIYRNVRVTDHSTSYLLDVDANKGVWGLWLGEFARVDLSDCHFHDTTSASGAGIFGSVASHLYCGESSTVERSKGKGLILDCSSSTATCDPVHARLAISGSSLADRSIDCEPHGN